MDTCHICSDPISDRKIGCMGVCYHVFHASCLKRGTKISPDGLITCDECADIKPCHVLRFISSFANKIYSEQSIIDSKVNSIFSNIGGLQLLSDDITQLYQKLDRILDSTGHFDTNSSEILSKFHTVANKISSVSSSIDDLREHLSEFAQTTSPGSSDY